MINTQNKRMERKISDFLYSVFFCLLKIEIYHTCSLSYLAFIYTIYTLSQIFAFTTFRYQLDFSMIINTFVLRLHSFTNMKTIQIICFERSLLLLPISIPNPKQNVYRVSNCISHTCTITRMIMLRNCARYSD